MMANLYAALYRTYLGLKKSAAEGALRRWPGTGRGLDQLKRLDRTSFPPQGAGLGADSIRLIAGNVDASPSSWRSAHLAWGA